jgi:hypothetical protein
MIKDAGMLRSGRWRSQRQFAVRNSPSPGRARGSYEQLVGSSRLFDASAGPSVPRALVCKAGRALGAPRQEAGTPSFAQVDRCTAVVATCTEAARGPSGRIPLSFALDYRGQDGGTGPAPPRMPTHVTQQQRGSCSSNLGPSIHTPAVIIMSGCSTANIQRQLVLRGGGWSAVAGRARAAAHPTRQHAGTAASLANKHTHGPAYTAILYSPTPQSWGTGGTGGPGARAAGNTRAARAPPRKAAQALKKPSRQRSGTSGISPSTSSGLTSSRRSWPARAGRGAGRRRRGSADGQGRARGRRAARRKGAHCRGARAC